MFYGWVVLAACFFTTLVSWGFYYSFGVFFTDLQSAFGADRAAVSLISSICISTVYMMGLPYGWAVDKFGPRAPVAIGGALICVGLLLSSRATAVWQLYLTMGFLVGFGTSATVVPSISVLAKWFVKMRGVAIGVQSAGAGVGMMVMAPLSHWLLARFGWRDSFVALGLATLVVFGLGALLMRGDPKEKGLAPYGAARQDDRRPSDQARGTRIPSAVSPGNSVPLREAMKGRDLWLVLGIRLALPLTLFMVNTHLVNYAKDAGMSPASAAMLMTILAAVGIVSKVVTGHLVDRTGSRSIIIVCAACLAALMLWLAGPKGGWMLPAFAAVYGAAYGGSFPIMNTIVAEAFGTRQLGRILGFANIGSAIGSLLGPWLAGFVFDVTGSYSVAFLVAAGASLAAIVLVIPFGRRPPRPTPRPSTS